MKRTRDYRSRASRKKRITLTKLTRRPQLKLKQQLKHNNRKEMTVSGV